MIQVSLDTGRAGTEIVTIEQKSNNGINHFNIGTRSYLAKKQPDLIPPFQPFIA